MSADLISRSALIKMLRFKRRAVYGSGSMDDIARVIEDVEKFPAAKVGKAQNAEPVRHGWWNGRGYYLECSECEREFTQYDWEGSVVAYYWCPNCGAKMHTERTEVE